MRERSMWNAVLLMADLFFKKALPLMILFALIGFLLSKGCM